MKISASPMALVLAGGRSARMGMNKAFICYHQMPQYLHIGEICRQAGFFTVLSGNDLPLGDTFHARIADIPEFAGHGPISGLLSAYRNFQQPILLIGCDYPLLEANFLNTLLQKRNFANTFADIQGKLLPMPALFETDALELLLADFHRGEDSIIGFLKKYVHRVQVFPCENPDMLISADTPEIRDSIMQQLRQKQG
jgi:molybdenum cofactor guanylyltransferase